MENIDSDYAKTKSKKYGEISDYRIKYKCKTCF